MEKYIPIICLFFFFAFFAMGAENSVFAREGGGVFSSGIENKISEESGEEKIEVIIRLKTKEENIHLQAKKKEGGEAAVNALKSEAESSQAGVMAELSRGGANIKNSFWITNAILAEVNTDDLRSIAQKEEVKRIHENFEVSILEHSKEDPPFSLKDVEGFGNEEEKYTWGLERMGVPEVWGMGFKGSEEIKVAVLDTGVDIDHPDLEGKMYTEDEEDPTYPGGWAEFNVGGKKVGSEPHDTHYHGTHVSGTVVGGNESESGTYIGVAPNAKFMHGLVIPYGSGSFAQIIGGMEWATEEGADVVNMSFGADAKEYYDEFEEAIQSMKGVGIFPVAAIGNEGEGTAGTPGAILESIGVGASTDDGYYEWPQGEFNEYKENDIVGFSSGDIIIDEEYNNSPEEEYVKPDFSAPGVNVKSAVPGNDYYYLNGTSMAAPHVAGIIALMLQVDPELEIDDAYNILRDTVDYYRKEGDWLDSEENKNTRYGYGIVNAHNAVQQIADDAYFDIKEISTNQPVVVGEVLEVEATVTNTGDIKDTQNIKLLDFDSEKVDETEITLYGGDSKEVSLIWETDDTDGGVDNIKVESDDDTLEKEVEILEEAYFEVNITGDYPSVNEGETLEVTADIENTGTETSTEDIYLLNFEDEIVDKHEDLEIEGENSESISLEWNTEYGDADTGNITVKSSISKNSDTKEVTIDAISYFDLEIIGTNRPVKEGGDLAVEVRVENVGSANAQSGQTIELYIEGESPEDSKETKALESGESESLELVWSTEVGDFGTYLVEIKGEDEEDEKEIAIKLSLENDNVELIDLWTEKEEIYAGWDLEIGIEIENNNSEEGKYNAVFKVGKEGEEMENIGSSTKVVPGEGSEVFSVLHAGKSAGTYNAKTEEDEAEVSFEVYDEPDVITGEVEAGYESAIFHGEVTEKGMENEIEVFFKWIKEGDLTYESTDPVLIEDPQGDEKFQEELGELESGTTYSFRSAISWEEGEHRNTGEEKEFVTASFPAVETLAAKNISYDSATLSGDLTEIGLEDNIDTFFSYREKGEEEWSSTSLQEVSNEESFNEEIDSLSSNTEYEFRAEIEWNGKSEKGEVLEFSTDSRPTTGGGGGGRSPRTREYDIKLSINKEDAGEVKGGGSYEEGEEVTIEAVPEEGYYFLGWEEAGEVVSSKESFTFTLEEDRELVALFREESRIAEVEEVQNLRAELDKLDGDEKRIKGVIDVANTLLEEAKERGAKEAEKVLKRLIERAEILKGKIEEKKEEKKEELREILWEHEEKEEIMRINEVLDVVIERAKNLLDVAKRRENKEAEAILKEIIKTAKEEKEIYKKELQVDI